MRKRSVSNNRGLSGGIIIGRDTFNYSSGHISAQKKMPQLIETSNQLCKA
ncbi:hypothetical protein ACIQ1D_02760 [Lysinibacillus xylanilyticus]